MHTKIMKILTVTLFALSSANAIAEELLMEEAHGQQLFHSFRLEAQTGNARREGAVQEWNFDGWIGGDSDKLWIKSEGERLAGRMEKAEFQALYSRNIATFWDAQIGLRQNTSPQPDTYLTLGFEGLAPYYFETQAHLFISDKGYISARLSEENDILLTQQLITKPYAQVELSLANDKKQQLGAGLSRTMIGIQTRYEFTRKLAPYVDVRYERAFGNTAGILQQEGETGDDFIVSVGLRIMF